MQEIRRKIGNDVNERGEGGHAGSGLTKDDPVLHLAFSCSAVLLPFSISLLATAWLSQSASLILP